jgi:hypothetical protein
MIMSARIESSTARCTCASVIATPFSAALALIFSRRGRSRRLGPLAVERGGQVVRFGCGGQSGRAQEGPARLARTDVSSSPSERKNSCQLVDRAGSSA